MKESHSYQQAADHLQALRLKEDSCGPKRSDYFSPPDSEERVTVAWRRKLCEWCYAVVDHFGFSREVVAIAMSYLDKFVCKQVEAGRSVSKRNYQLYMVSSFYLALKVHGGIDDPKGTRRRLPIDAFVELSRGFFSVEDIEETERCMLVALEWKVNPSTAVRFISTFLNLCPCWTVDGSHSAYNRAMSGIFDNARYLTELALYSTKLSIDTKSSLLAYCALLLGIQSVSNVPKQVTQSFLDSLDKLYGYTPGSVDAARVRDSLACLSPMKAVSDFQAPSTPKPTKSPDFKGKSSPISVTSSFTLNDLMKLDRKRRRDALN